MKVVYLYGILAMILWLLLGTPAAYSQAITSLPSAGAAQCGDLLPMANLSRSTTLAYAQEVCAMMQSGLPVSSGALTVNTGNVVVSSAGATVTAPGLIATGATTAGTYVSAPSLHLGSTTVGPGGSTSTFLRGDGTLATAGGNPGGSNTYVQYNASGAFAGDSGMTYTTGTSSLAVTGGATVGTLSVTSTTTPATFGAGVTATGAVTAGTYLSAPALTVNTATIAAGGSTTTFLRADGALATPAGTTTPGGPTTAVQFNDGGTMNGTSGMEYTKSTSSLAVTGGATVGTLSVTGNVTTGATVTMPATFGLSQAPATTQGATVTNNLWTFNGLTTDVGGTVIGSSTSNISILPAQFSASLVLNIGSGGASDFRFLNAAANAWVPISSLSSWIASTGTFGFGSTTNPETQDGGFSRLGAASVALGNGTAGNTTGALSLGSLNSTGAVSAGSITANTNGITPAAGVVGNYVTATVASGGSSVTTATPANITSITLAPGNWLVTGACNLELLAATATVGQCALGNQTAVMLTQAGTVSGGMTIGTEATSYEALAVVAASGTQSVPLTPVYVQITAGSGTPKLFLNVSCTFSAGSCKAYGSINAIRMFVILSSPLEVFLLFFAILKRKFMRLKPFFILALPVIFVGALLLMAYSPAFSAEPVAARTMDRDVDICGQDNSVANGCFVISDGVCHMHIAAFASPAAVEHENEHCSGMRHAAWQNVNGRKCAVILESGNQIKRTPGMMLCESGYRYVELNP